MWQEKALKYSLCRNSTSVFTIKEIFVLDINYPDQLNVKFFEYRKFSLFSLASIFRLFTPLSYRFSDSFLVFIYLINEFRNVVRPIELYAFRNFSRALLLLKLENSINFLTKRCSEFFSTFWMTFKYLFFKFEDCYIQNMIEVLALLVQKFSTIFTKI